MNLSQLVYSPSQLPSHLLNPKIIGDFYLNKSRFLIVSENNLGDSVFLLNKNINPTVVGQFTFEGETYEIVRESEFAEKKKSNSTKVLTAREFEIATLVAQGKSNKQIAKQLQISKWTVSTHLRRIFTKLGVDNRAAMVYKCFGIVRNTTLNRTSTQSDVV